MGKIKVDDRKKKKLSGISAVNQPTEVRFSWLYYTSVANPEKKRSPWSLVVLAKKI